MTVALLRHLHHVVDRLLDEVVGDLGAAAFGRHDSGTSREPVDGVLVENRLALGDAGAPRGFVPGPRGTGNPLAVAGAAGLLEELGAILRNRHLGRARARGTR